MITIAIKSLLNRKGAIVLTILSITLCVSLLIGVERLRTGIKSSFARTVSGVDLIVGARTGSTNLLLYSVFHIGDAVNGVKYDSYLRWRENEDVEWSFPVALGDSHRGYRVVGTTNDHFTHYQYGENRNLAFKEGSNFETHFDVVLGSEVAKTLNYSLGQEVVVSHGVGEVTLSEHDNLPFSVKGVLETTGTPIDKTVFVPLEGITAIHLGWETGIQLKNLTQESALEKDLTPKTVTAFFLGTKRKTAIFGLQREISEDEIEPLTAILPGKALYDLWSMMAIAERSLALVTFFVVFISLITMMITEITALKQREREMALLRSLGATPTHLFMLLFFESVIMATAGAFLGLLLLYPVQAMAEPILSSNGLYLPLALPSKAELTLLLQAWTAGLLIGLAPAFMAYRKTLHQNLIPKS